MIIKGENKLQPFTYEWEWKTENPLQSDNGICFIEKQLPEVLIHLSHWETRHQFQSYRKRQVAKGLQPHPLLHFLVRMKPTLRSLMSFFRSPKMWKPQGDRSGLYGGCCGVSTAKSLKLTTHQNDSMGTGVIMQKDDPSDSIDFVARCSNLSHQETNHTSLLFFDCLHFQC